MLVPETKNLVGKLLEISPMYAEGWIRSDEEEQRLDYEDVLNAGSFHARLTSLWEWQGELRGGIARVEQDGHPYDSYWVVFWTMWVVTYSLGGPGHCRIDVQIGPDEPRFRDDWPHIESGVPRFSGHVQIRPVE